jgi:hypothetical protein
MFGDKDKRGHKLGSRLSSIFTGDNDGHKLHVPTIRTDDHKKLSSVLDRSIHPKTNLLKQSIVNSSASRGSRPTTNEANLPKNTPSTPKYQTRSLLDPVIPKKSPETLHLGVQNALSTQTSPQSNSSKLRRKPPPDLNVEPTSRQSTPDAESISNNSSFDDFHFNVDPHQPGSKTPESEKNSPEKAADIDELINQIDTELEDLDVELNNHSPKKANRYATIPRSPNITQLSDYNHSNTSLTTELLTRPLESSNLKKNDPLSSEPSSPAHSTKDNRWEVYLKESDASSLQSPFASESHRLPATNVLENSSTPSLPPTSLQKDLFLNYSSSVDHRSDPSFNTSPINDSDSRSEGLDDFLRYQSFESLNGDMKSEASGYGGVMNPEEYKLSFQTSVENPIIENQEMLSSNPYMQSPTQEVPYPISTLEPQSPISPQISLGDINHDFSRQEYVPSEHSTIGTYGDFSNKGLDSPVDATEPFSRTLSNISSPGSRQLPYRRNSIQPVILSPIEPTISQSSIKRHRQTNSISSIFSMNSNRPGNLASIKKSLNLKPGEGERSNYVVSIRRSGGTAYNENGPGKWKLPVGIRPVDKSASAMNANGKYMRLAGPFSQNKLKKASGVESKHGHLQPRLLAGEIDDSYTAGTKQRIGVLGDSKTQLGDIKSSESSITPSTTTTLNRTTTGGSINTNDIGSSVTSSSNASPHKRTDSIESSSSGSLSEGIGEGFYQHPGYKYSDRDEEDTEEEMHGFVPSQRESMECEERPKLKLANPDIDTDSD